MNSGGTDPVLVKIRVKERVADRRSPRRLRSPEKMLLLVLGACVGLGLGYLAAGLLAGFMRPALHSVRVRDRAPDPAPAGEAVAPAATPDIDFDLPAPRD
ncbi:MAG: hypothetical protein PHN82_10715 [bacterium]|nr:hypothetical protein [bacterium]